MDPKGGMQERREVEAGVEARVEAESEP